MAKLEIRVKVREIKEPYKSPTSDFSKTTIVGIIEGEHPEVFAIDFNKKKQELLDEIVEGCYVSLTCNVRGREVEKDGKIMHFTSLECYKAENIRLSKN